MITSIGIDSVDIERFAHWNTYNHKTLSKIFQKHEIDYCLTNVKKSAERFAVRFAAKEAFYKAFCQAVKLERPLSLISVCKYVSIVHHDSKPTLEVTWRELASYTTSAELSYRAHVSLTHAKTVATAVVILETITLKGDCVCL